MQRQCYTLASTHHCTLIFTYKDVRRLTADVCLAYLRQNDTDSATQVCSFGCTCNVTIGTNFIYIELENHFFRIQHPKHFKHSLWMKENQFLSIVKLCYLFTWYLKTTKTTLHYYWIYTKIRIQETYLHISHQ